MINCHCQDLTLWHSLGFKKKKTGRTYQPAQHRGGPPRDFGEQGKKGIYFRGTGEQRPNFEGEQGNKDNIGEPGT